MNKTQQPLLDKNNLMGQARELLKIHYGYDSFWPGQEQVINNILEGSSTVVIMPTGGGKSLCYQLPALILDGITIVISPLIALMKDQVDSLSLIGVPATFINSSISFADAYGRLEMIKQGKFKLLYIAPERFYNKEFMEILSDIKVSLFAVDEAHCISSWGHDFRPSYLKLREAIKRFGQPTVLALTATATPEVRVDIIKQLGLTDPKVVVTGFARPNLQFGAMQASDARKSQCVLDAISGLGEASGIIYAGTRAKVDELTQRLLENNIEAVSYHAGMESEDRKWVQDNFMEGKVKVIVATNAFGLGIDKPDIRFVIHYDMPGTVEAYYQEAGRAGRDGKQSFCLLLYSLRDRYLREFFIKGDNPPSEVILEIYEILLDYHRRDTARDTEPCDSGRDKDSDNVLFTYAEIKDILSSDVPEMAVGTAIKILEREGYIARSREKTGSAYLRFTSGYDVIADSLGKRMRIGREILEKLYSRFKDELTQGWQFNLEETAGIINVKKDSLTRLVRKLADEGLVEYRPPFKGTEVKILKRVELGEVTIDFSALREKLKRAYEKLDRMEDYVYHFGCRQEYILNYFGDKAARKCGKCDNCLTRGGYVRKTEAPERSDKRNKWKYNRNKAEINRNEIELGEDKSRKAKLPTKLTQLETFELYNQGMSIDEMAVARGVKQGTIVQHLCYLVEKGLPVKVDKFVSVAKQREIKKAIDKVGGDKLTPIKEEAGDDVSWDEVKLVVASSK